MSDRTPTAGLEAQGIETRANLHWNLVTARLIQSAIARGEGKLSADGPLVVETGAHTGRSAQDKFIVRDAETESTVWWGKSNKAMSPEHFAVLKADFLSALRDKEDLFVQDLFGGSQPEHRVNVRVINELAWHNSFIRTMLVRPEESELRGFVPDYTIIDLPSFRADPARHGCRSETIIAVNFTDKLILIGGTKYAGEMKKSVFSLLNYLLPPTGVMPMHCSANIGKDGDTAVFFGLSGTGKTTLSTDPKRELIGDDEHGWDDDGVFNFEGGCYAKVINLSQENEPDIWNAIRRNALLENVTVDKKGKIDYADKSVTENTRVSYPIFHIENIVKPVSKAPAAKKVIFLSADAFGVLPPVSILNSEQTKYYFLSGFTAKLAGTERGITEPTPTFSACFGAAFLSLHPTKYGEELVKKMKKAGAKAYLVNTGWNGTGKRISIKDTRGIIDAILDGSIDKAPTKTLPIFDFTIPTELPGVDPKILDPRDTYKNAKDWDVKAEDLANRFVKNFVKFTGNEEGKKLVAAGPKVK